MAGINYEQYSGAALTVPYKAGGAISANVLVVLSADDTVSATTAADSEVIIGKTKTAISAADATAGKTVDVEMFGSKIVLLLAGGTVTRGLCVKCQGNDGKVENVGATPEPDAVIGRALKSGSSGELIPVLI